MMSLGDAVQLAASVGRDRRRKPIILADVADNPGGGGRGNTTYLLRGAEERRRQGRDLRRVQRCGAGRQGARAGRRRDLHRLASTPRRHHEFSLPFDCEAKVVKLSDGKLCRPPRRAANVAADMGPSALLDLGGIQIVVITHRCQCMDPRQFEMFGLDIAQARVVVVKSRGHFRGGFDEFFKPEQIYEVDCPGLTSPVLANFTWTQAAAPGLSARRRDDLDTADDRLRGRALACCAVHLLARHARSCSPARRRRSRTQDAARGHALGSQDPRSDLDHRLHRAQPRLHDLRHAVRARRQARAQAADGRQLDGERRQAHLDLHPARRAQWHDGQPVTADDVRPLDQALGRTRRAGPEPARQDRPGADGGRRPDLPDRAQGAVRPGAGGAGQAGLGAAVHHAQARRRDADPDSRSRTPPARARSSSRRTSGSPARRSSTSRNPDYKPRAEPPSGLAGGKVAKVDRVEWVVDPRPRRPRSTRCWRARST